MVLPVAPEIRLSPESFEVLEKFKGCVSTEPE
jgi:hypothetical protein